MQTHLFFSGRYWLAIDGSDTICTCTYSDSVAFDEHHMWNPMFGLMGMWTRSWRHISMNQTWVNRAFLSFCRVHAPFGTYAPFGTSTPGTSLRGLFIVLVTIQAQLVPEVCCGNVMNKWWSLAPFVVQLFKGTSIGSVAIKVVLQIGTTTAVDFLSVRSCSFLCVYPS